MRVNKSSFKKNNEIILGQTRGLGGVLVLLILIPSVLGGFLEAQK